MKENDLFSEKFLSHEIEFGIFTFHVESIRLFEFYKDK